MKKFYISILRDNDGTITKHISHENGKLIKTPKATVKNGWVQNKEFT